MWDMLAKLEPGARQAETDWTGKMGSLERRELSSSAVRDRKVNRASVVLWGLAANKERQGSPEIMVGMEHRDSLGARDRMGCLAMRACQEQMGSGDPTAILECLEEVAPKA